MKDQVRRLEGELRRASARRCAAEQVALGRLRDGVGDPEPARPDRPPGLGPCRPAAGPARPDRRGSRTSRCAPSSSSAGARCRWCCRRGEATSLRLKPRARLLEPSGAGGRRRAERVSAGMSPRSTRTSASARAPPAHRRRRCSPLALVALGARMVDLALPTAGERGRRRDARRAVVQPAAAPTSSIATASLLATDYPKASVFADPARGASIRRRRPASSRACCTASTRPTLRAKLSADGRFVWLKRHVTDAEQRAVIRLGLPGHPLSHRAAPGLSAARADRASSSAMSVSRTRAWPASSAASRPA